MILLEVGGVQFENFTSVSVTRSMEAISGSFSFAATSNETSIFPIKRRQRAKVVIGADTCINGYVEKINVNYSAGSHDIGIEGRDVTADVIDSSLIGPKDFNAPISLSNIMRIVLDGNGLNKVGIINTVKDLKDFESGEFVSASNGEKMFEFLEKYARKRQVFLTTDGNGSIMIIRGGTNNGVAKLIHDRDSQQCNILSASVSYDDTERFGRYTFQSQLNPSALSDDEIDITTVSNQTGTVVDKEIRQSRVMEAVSESSSDSLTAEERATWECNIRRARSSEYTATVQGFYQDIAQKHIWKPDLLIDVQDSYANINERLLVKSVAYSYSLDGGSKTQLTMVNKDAFTLQANEKEKRKGKKSDFGGDFKPGNETDINKAFKP